MTYEVHLHFIGKKAEKIDKLKKEDKQKQSSFAVQWVKDPGLSLQQLRKLPWHRCDPQPWNMLQAQPKKKEREREREREKENMISKRKRILSQVASPRHPFIF